jgi:hypothetical protein
MARWLYASAALAATTASKTLETDAAIALHQPRSHSTATAENVNAAEQDFYTESATAWNVSTSMSIASTLQISAPSAELFGESATAWNTPINMQTEYSALVAQASQSYAKMSALGIHYATPKYLENAIPQLGTDYYTIRPSEYDLRQSELLTGVSNVFNLDTPEHIPSPIFNIASYKLTDLPAYPIYAGGMFSVHMPANKPAPANLAWGPGESLYAQPDLPYTVQPPLIPGAPVLEPDIRETYISMNSVNVVALPGNEPLAVADVKLDLDKKSAAWKCSFTVLNSASAALIEPTAAGQKEVAITINGWRWECFIDSVPESKSFSGDTLNHRYTASGYSRSQYLGNPYAPLRSASAASTTAVQAITDELFGTGFTLDWDTAKIPDWTMSSSAFSYQGLTPLQVITKMATAVGAIVQPGMNANTITVRPEYYPLPWDLASSTPDHSISEHQIETFDKTRVYNKLINAVVVSGEQDVSGAVSLTVTRAGTAGDTFGDDVSDAWLTSFDANKSRGAQAIAASGVRMRYTLSTAVPESISTEPGIILPGQTVAVIYDDTAQSFRAYVDSVSISAPGNGLADVTQTVVLDRPIEWEA